MIASFDTLANAVKDTHVTKAEANKLIAASF